MITITENARKELEAFFSDKPKSGIRIYLAPGGCSGPRLAMALDEPTDDDTVVEAGGFTFSVTSSLLNEAEGMNIDLGYMGFIVEPRVPLAAMKASSGCSGCGGGCGSSGCC